MIRFALALQFIGNIAYIETVTHAHRELPFIVQARDGEPDGLVVLRLAQWAFPPLNIEDGAHERAQILGAIARLEELASMLAALDQIRCRAELSLMCHLSEDWGKFFYFRVIEDVIVVAAAARLSLGISLHEHSGNDDGDGVFE